MLPLRPLLFLCAVAVCGSTPPAWSPSLPPPVPSPPSPPPTRSSATAHNATRSPAQRTDVRPEMVLESLRRHEASSPYVSRLLNEPWFEPMVRTDRNFRRLFMRARPALKEASEAFAALSAIETLHGSLELSGSDGRGLCVLDVCSGKGIIATLLSLLLPEARVTMLDVDGRMDLSHVADRPNLEFEHLDLFSREAAGTLERLARADGCHRTLALGMHLCGALSPRLATLWAHVEAIDAMLLCPCCLKGALGAFAKTAAAEAIADPTARVRSSLLGEPLLARPSTGGASDGAAGVPTREKGRGGPSERWPLQYRTLVETLGALTEREVALIGRTLHLELLYDGRMISPANGIVSAHRLGPEVTAAPEVAAESHVQTAPTSKRPFCNKGVERMLEQYRRLDGVTCAC